MNYNYITNITSPNKWVGGNTVQALVIHWWNDPAVNPSAEGVVSWLCNPASQVSAHLVITGTGRRVWQLVADKDRAWHAGTFANANTLGLELDPRQRDSDYDVAAEVIANLWKFYGKLPLRPHNYYVESRCPGTYDLARLEREANAKFNGTPRPNPNPAPAVREKSRVVYDPIKTFEFNKDSRLHEILTGAIVKDTEVYRRGEEIDIKQLLTLTNNNKYYRTAYSSKNEIGRGFRAEDLKEVIKVPNAVPLKTPIKFLTNKDKVEVWDLNTHPNYKSTKTLSKGEDFVAFAEIKFNGMTYYVTEYSYGKGWKHGVNRADLVLAPVETPKPTPAPTPAPAETPKPTPTLPPETEAPAETTPPETQTPTPTPTPAPEPAGPIEDEDVKGEETPVEGAEEDERPNALEVMEIMNKQTQEVLMANTFKPVISERVKTIAYFVTDIGALLATFALAMLVITSIIDGDTAVYINSAVVALMVGLKATFRLSSKES